MAKATPAKPAKKPTAKKAAATKDKTAASQESPPPKESAAPKKASKKSAADDNWRAAEAVLRHEIESVRRDLSSARDELASAHRALVERDAELETLRRSLDEAHSELKLAQTQLAVRVDEGWSTEAAVSAELQEAREAEKHAAQAAEAARAEARVLKSELDRLRQQISAQPRSGATLPGIGIGAQKQPTASGDPAKLDKSRKDAPEKAAADDQTAKNTLPLDENKPGFWGSLFKRKKDED